MCTLSPKGLFTDCKVSGVEVFFQVKNGEKEDLAQAMACDLSNGNPERASHLFITTFSK